ncbi:formylglycine-generating enzyme family protein [Streptomyces winkii]|uniref:formylglycine-generating enzyme family protein n=1 Tax=Streptomyces winkii TaxID=3051178 RepID=UPI0028D54BFB|nr:formylglycine-generating enzyme family protein [Streptomyces sp. DSM 40971]
MTGTRNSRAPRACCAPSRGSAAGAGGTAGAEPGPGTAQSGSASGSAPGSATEGPHTPHGGWCELPGGAFLMGCDDAPYPADGEGPVREVTLAPLRLAATAVTAAEFADFVAATGHRTDAERFGWSFVFGGFLPPGFPPTRAAAAAPWWRQVHGADWRHPEGPGSDLDGREDHPVVHVSHNDALAYCTWAGTRLPTEAEWEYGARGGLSGEPYPWGRERDPGGTYRMNIWRGSFPDRNTAADGYAGTCPVDAFPANGHGLFNMTGNVWEWSADLFAAGSDSRALRGGSHLCHESYCLRYRTSARMANTPDSSSGNTGFRVASGSGR